MCLYAQIEWHNPNFREKKIAVSDSVVLDSLQILPEKFSLKDFNNREISPELYRVKGNVLYLNSLVGDSLKVAYYVHPDFKEIVTYPQDPSLIVSSHSERTAWVLDNQTEEKKELFDGLNSQGTLVRGLVFGNNQGSSVQSSLNLQLDGKLSEDVGIKAFVSDTNAPLEVDGYTQNLNQFEQIYIELFTKKSKLRAGNIDLEQNQDYFGRFKRKVTGLKLSHTFETEESTTLIEAAGSLNRGQYTKYEFLGSEGNQGPYRLSGNNNEAYVLIIAGSERVYRNGRLLESGENKDYVLDYTTGEITFTNQHLVTANDRFIIEYQYTNRNYNRFTWFAGAEHKRNKFKISSHIYSESDSKEPLNQNFTEEELLLLSNAGNQVQNLYSDSGIRAEYEEGRVLYKKTMLNGVEIYEYSTNETDELYQVNFTYLGKNQGDYIFTNEGVNGRVFRYVSPINNISQGDYLPVNLLVAPERRQVISLATEYDLGENESVRLDLGVSNNDVNLLSDINNDENVGLGVKLSANKQIKLNKFSVNPEISYEYIQDKFNPIERLRNPEFARDFNLENELERVNQHFLQSNVMFYVNDSAKVNYGLDYLNQEKVYQGVRHRISGDYDFRGYKLTGNGSYLNTKSTEIESNFTRYNILSSKKLKNTLLRLGVNGENNRNYYNKRDSLSSRWNEFYASALVGDSIQRFVQLSTYYRTDDSTRLAKLSPYSRSWGMQFKSRLIQNANHNLEFLADYRKVNYQNELDDASFLNFRLDWMKTFLNRGVTLNVNYGLSGNTEQQRAFTYVKVADGLGIYKWVDFNGDGIQQIDEFEVAEFIDQANYIRVFTNVVESIRTNRNNFGFNLNLQPSRFLKTDFWKRIQSRVIYNVSGNYLKNGEIAKWNLFDNSSSARSRNSNLFIQNNWNKGKSYRWHFIHEFKIQENSNLIFTGIESIANQDNKFDLQYDLTDFVQLELVQNIQKTESESQSFASRRFELIGNSWSPKLNVNLSNNIQSSLAYIYRDFENKTGIEELKGHQLNFSFSWNDLGKTSVLANLDWVKNDFIGNQDNLVANRMMQGLRGGNNLVWSLNFSRNINNFMTVDLQYNGRKNEQLNAIHTGNIQVRLNF